MPSPEDVLPFVLDSRFLLRWVLRDRDTFTGLNEIAHIMSVGSRSRIEKYSGEYWANLGAGALALVCSLEAKEYVFDLAAAWEKLSDEQKLRRVEYCKRDAILWELIARDLEDETFWYVHGIWAGDVGLIFEAYDLAAKTECHQRESRIRQKRR